MRCLAGKCCMSKLSQQLPSTFQPHQRGVGTTSGAEAVVHACRNFIGDASSTNEVLLKIDFKNAFNTIRRDCVLQKVFEFFLRFTSLFIKHMQPRVICSLVRKFCCPRRVCSKEILWVHCSFHWQSMMLFLVVRVSLICGIWMMAHLEVMWMLF